MKQSTIAGLVFSVPALVVAYGLAGTEELDSVLVERSHYCTMVASGYWPDYRGILTTECNENQGD